MRRTDSIVDSYFHQQLVALTSTFHLQRPLLKLQFCVTTQGLLSTYLNSDNKAMVLSMHECWRYRCLQLISLSSLSSTYVLWCVNRNPSYGFNCLMEFVLVLCCSLNALNQNIKCRRIRFVLLLPLESPLNPIFDSLPFLFPTISLGHKFLPIPIRRDFQLRDLREGLSSLAGVVIKKVGDAPHFQIMKGNRVTVVNTLLRRLEEEL